ncbi:hypothetical protein [Longimicrobium terrae]|uniref:Tfp pilus assembly protein PilN n=1 Tax=Longimicrobium terrae TaxID=1639882 RepID=A0A841GX75_9BACT|nr:hypothetical protein [Longimicrobium terrae]MBB4635989.1 Tfp pilus assembly protein PilN [Longimicrobium terrae]MBB6070385.1 Tfp pilus assembly protein PilN [Longimicrobium terrae]NNC30881.1 hypothetical protein [Longimicrobium terrae]
MGADLGVRRIKLAAVGGPPGAAELVWATDVPTSEGVFGPEGRFDAVAAGRVLAGLLARGLASAGAPSAWALLLPSAALRVRRLQAPPDPASLARVLAEDSELRVPGVPPGGLHYAVCAVGDTPGSASGDGRGSLVAAAARRDAIRAYAAAAHAAGMRPLRLAVPAAALATLHARLHPEERDQPVLLLHVGSARSELVVVHGGAPLLALSVVQGTDTLASGGRSEPDRAGGDATLDEWVGRLRGAHRTAVGAAERHLRLSIDGLPVRVSGGVTRLPGVMESLGRALPGAVGVLDPGEAFRGGGGGDALGPGLVLALGAALEASAASPGSSPSRDDARRPVLLDLSVPEPGAARVAIRDRVVLLARDRAVWAGLVAALALGAGVPAELERRVRRGEEGLAEARQAFGREAARVASDSARVSALRADSARLAGTLGTLASLEADRYGWPRLMHTAAEALPEHGWLEGVELEAGTPGAPLQFRVQGVLPAQDDVSRYVRALGRVEGFGDVRPGDSESLAAGPVPLVGFRVAGHHAAASGTPDQPRPGGPGYQSSESTPSPTLRPSPP